MPPIVGNLLESVLANAVGYGTGTALSAALDPVVQGIRNELWAAEPTMPLDAGLAARLAIRFPGEAGGFATEAKQTGFNAARFEYLRRASESAPGIGEVLDLLNRGEISEATAVEMLRHAELAERFIAPTLALRHVLLSPADLAMMRQQSFIDQGEQLRRSSLQGVDAADAQLLFEISGEPPGPETMVELWRRGKVSEQDVRQAVVEGRLKLKWTDAILALREVPLSASIAAEAVLRERHLPQDPHYYAAAAGVSAADFDAWVDMMGRPIGDMQAITLYRRGQFTKAQVREVVARSDVRTEYTDALLELARAIPSLYEIRQLVKTGAITDELATSLVIDEGYTPAIAAGVVQAAHNTKTQTQRDLAASQIRDLFEGGFETRDWALGALQDLGYTAPEATLYLDLIEAARIITYLKAALGRIKSKYVSHDASEASTLDALGLLGASVDARQAYMALWDVEREANVRRLTDAQIGKAYKLGIITEPDAVARWVEHGYPQADAEVLALLAVHPQSAQPAPT